MKEDESIPDPLGPERALLATLAMSPVEVRAICAEAALSKAHFGISVYGEVFEIMTSMVDHGKTIDFVTMMEALSDAGKLVSFGGAFAINQLFVLLGTTSGVDQYIELILDRALRRSVMALCNEFGRRANDMLENAQEMASALHGGAGSLIHRKSKRRMVSDLIDEIVQEVINGKDDSALVKTNMPGVDGRLNLYRGDLLVVSAPTSCGKTALSFQLAYSFAKFGHRVALYPLEMKDKNTIKRAIPQIGGHNPEFVRALVKQAKETGKSSAQQQKIVQEFSDAAHSVKLMKIHMRDDLNLFEAIRADIRVEHARQPFTFIVPDYLQLIQTGQKFERKQLQIAYITQGLKALAKELDCVVCVPSQVNKEGGTREAQDAENDADALIRIEGKEDPKTKDIQPGRVSVWKQREGARGIDLPLNFNGPMVRWEEYQP